MARMDRCLLGVAILAAFPSFQNARPPATREIARAIADFNGDGLADTLTIRALSPRSVTDTAAWCGAGVKDTGRFDVVVWVSPHTKTETRLNDFFRGETLAFTAGRWSVVVADYDGDGRVDFNLGQYASCNGWAYRLFTVTDSGSIRELRVQPERLIRADDFANSTRAFVLIPGGGFEARWYDNSRGTVQTRYCRSMTANVFVVRDERTINDRSQTRERREPCGPRRS
jgi:hypothetical protein